MSRKAGGVIVSGPFILGGVWLRFTLLAGGGVSPDGFRTWGSARFGFGLRVRVRRCSVRLDVRLEFSEFEFELRCRVTRQKKNVAI